MPERLMVHGDDAGAAVFANIDVTLTLETTENLAHRRPGKPVALAQTHLVEVLVRIEFHRQNLPLEIVVKAVLAAFHLNLLPNSRRTGHLIRFDAAKFARHRAGVNKIVFFLYTNKILSEYNGIEWKLQRANLSELTIHLEGAGVPLDAGTENGKEFFRVLIKAEKTI